jgi:hypothetical protein
MLYCGLCRRSSCPPSPGAQSSDIWTACGSEDYALEDYIKDYVRSADLEDVVERFSQMRDQHGWMAVDEERKRGLMQAVKVLKEIREREPELSGWRYRGWGCCQIE